MAALHPAAVRHPHRLVRTREFGPEEVAFSLEVCDVIPECGNEEVNFADPCSSLLADEPDLGGKLRVRRRREANHARSEPGGNCGGVQ